MKITVIPLEEAVGKPLAHDLTQIDTVNHKKSARFKKGQVITEEDIPVLRDMGRENLSIMEMSPGDVHEDDAAWSSHPTAGCSPSSTSVSRRTSG